jgi:hypothetical protein
MRGAVTLMSMYQKPKMQISWSHLEVANVGTPLVSIVVSKAVAKGLALAPIPRALFAVAIGFEPMKDRSGKNS